MARYIELIRHAATKCVSHPLKTTRIDVEVWFSAANFSRPDVDNILKPILDALQGIVYQDDAQVRSVLAAAVPKDENFGIACSGLRFDRLTKDEPREFLIKVYTGAHMRPQL